MGRRALIALAIAGGVLAPATAQAGTYDVYSCAFGANLYPNNAWVADGTYAGAPNGSVDTQCGAEGDVMSAALSPGVTLATQGWAGLTFNPPSGTTISDFVVRVRHQYAEDAADGNSQTAGLFRFGDGFFSGIGNLRADEATYLTKEGHFWGGGSPLDTTVTLSRRDSASAMARVGTMMILSADCGTQPSCTIGPNDRQVEQILGTKITIDDSVVLSVTAVADGQGLLAPGLRAGDEPITFSATDNTGIRRAEIVDVTNAANPIVVASEDYATATKTEAGTRCDFTRPRPCPDLKNEQIAASPAVGGHRTLVVRVVQIFQPGRGWRVFGNARTRKSGRFVARYRFNSAGSGRFTFRLRLRPNDAYPYARGFSRRMRVRVG